MDRTLDVRTPESIEFSYDLAGVGSRFLAVMIDLAVQIAVVALAATIFARILPAHHAASRDALTIAVAIAFVFLVFFGYFIVFEALWNGQTPGKKALGLRVVRDGGFPLDWGASLIRNLVRVVEAAAGFYAISAIVALLSPENRRVGDFAAGTLVVRISRIDEAESLLEQLRAPVYASTAFVSGEERALIRRFLERREGIVYERRATIAHQLAERVRPRVPAELQRLDDEALLERL
jgi:uncharacterized RDD family membrane protein YckC